MRRAARPARSRLRPRRDRDLAGAVRRSRASSELERARVPALAAAPRGVARAPTLRSGVPVVEWREGVPLEAVAGGGEGIQAPRPGRARLATGAGALLVAAVLRSRRCPAAPTSRAAAALRSALAALRRRCCSGSSCAGARPLALGAGGARRRVGGAASPLGLGRARRVGACSTPAGFLLRRRARLVVDRAAGARVVASRGSRRWRLVSVLAVVRGRSRARGASCSSSPARRSAAGSLLEIVGVLAAISALAVVACAWRERTSGRFAAAWPRCYLPSATSGA